MKVWLDCDPGQDDMLAIIMAALSPQMTLIGVSTSAGNSSVENTTRNALDILYEIGRDDIQVVKGAEGPLCCKLQTAENYHGPTGLQGAQLRHSPKQAVTEKPFLHIYNEITAEQEQVQFVVTGAMTNLAILLRAFPDIKQHIRGITMMGGAIGMGNASAAAEFNIYIDPQAAAIVFQSGLPITMVPLEVTHTVFVCNRIFGELGKLPSSFGQKLVPLMRYFQRKYKEWQNFDFPVAHDPCTIHYLLSPQDFQTRRAFVEIEVEGKSRGRTNCHFMHRTPNATVCQRINVQHF